MSVVSPWYITTLWQRIKDAGRLLEADMLENCRSCLTRQTVLCTWKNIIKVPETSAIYQANNKLQEYAVFI